MLLSAICKSVHEAVSNILLKHFVSDGKWFIARSNIAEIQDKRHSTLQITQRAIAVIAISEDGNDIFARTWPVTKSSMLTVKSNDSVLMIGPQDSIPVRIEICSVGKRNSQEMVDAFEAFVLPEDGSYKSPNGETEIDPMAERPSSLYYHNAQVVSIVTTTREKAKPVLPTDVTEDNFIDYDDDDDYVDIRACEIPPQTHYVNQTAAPQGPPPPRPPKLHRCTIKRPQRTKKEEDDYVISHVYVHFKHINMLSQKLFLPPQNQSIPLWATVLLNDISPSLPLWTNCCASCMYCWSSYLWRSDLFSCFPNA